MKIKNKFVEIPSRAKAISTAVHELNSGDILIVAGKGHEIYQEYKGKKKIIGICLGYQMILHNEGGKIVQQKRIYHGFQSKIKVTSNKSLFKKNKKFTVGRYHSLKLKEPFKANNFEITMRCVKTNTAMAFEDIKNNIYGFQFHPESFLTKNGKYFIQKIISA